MFGYNSGRHTRCSGVSWARRCVYETGTAPTRVFAVGGEMMAARLRHLVVLSDGAKAVTFSIRAA